ncbi:MAG: tetratricopeptide repeat protein [Pyrinomonadaceae bacterium]
MPPRLFASVCLALLLSVSALGQKLPQPKLTPVAPTDAQLALLRQGVALHERQDYDGAIGKYEEVLKENPDNVVALYEIAFAYAAKKDHPKALEYAYRGAQYKSDTLALLYVLIGNTLDHEGQPDKAVDTYKAGIKQMPDESLLYFNLAITYNRLGKADDAKRSVKQALALNPNHATSHLLLASMFQRGNYKTPALLAALRFLVLEPQTERSRAALQIARQILQGGVTPGKNENEIDIFLDPSAKTDEGDFSSLELFYGLAKAASMTKESKEKDKTEAQLLVDQFDSIFAVMSEMELKKVQGKFAGKYYVPYFIELKRRKFVEPFVYHTFRRSGVRGVTEWLQDHDARILEFLVWSKNYQWPRVD